MLRCDPGHRAAPGRGLVLATPRRGGTAPSWRMRRDRQSWGMTSTYAIEALGLTKRYGGKTAVDGLSFTVSPGRVTGFLGPNGAGKSPTMRLLLGLERPNGGQALINGLPYDALRIPLTHVGALLEAKSFHKGRSARNQLLCLAQTQALPAARGGQAP